MTQTTDTRSKITNFANRYDRKFMVALAGIAVGIAGVLMITGSRAATPFFALEPESGSISAPATAISDAAASGGAGVKFSTTGGVPPVPTLGWQLNATNTGLARFGLTCASLPAYTGNYDIPAGSNISGVRFTENVGLSKGNITIDKSCFQPIEMGQGMPIASTTDFNLCNDNGCPSARGVVTISNSEFDGSLNSLYLQAMGAGFHGIANLYNNYFHDMGSGPAIFNAGETYSAVLSGNYVRYMKGWGDAATDGNHSDAFTVRDFEITANPSRTLVVKGNRFDCDSPNATGAFFIQAYSGKINNLTVQDNFLEGNGYQLVLEGNANGYSNVRAINNRFSDTGYGAGYVDYTRGTGWTEQRDNYINDPTKTDNRGTLVTF